MIYESLLVLGVIFFTDLIFDVLTQSRHALMLITPRRILLFVVIGIYFTFFWHKEGQTLAMKTWQIRLTNAKFEPISWQQAVLRYFFAWLWFLPAILIGYTLNFKELAIVGLIALGMVIWALCIFFDKDRQFLHDKMAGTRLIIAPAIVKETEPTEQMK